ncbi:DUF4166 domain-containing protein [Microbacterium sp. JZ31]|uniref:DUF4166 domain-containing protein n=1 Tax=Microbacterium sp. JZ31 TaxID=1906274 RepID=UPI0019320032|nr:DUF4166 domain-containing protein [Microbacterium sp. JZ31]
MSPAGTRNAQGASPYERALGGRIDELHPTLRRYFTSLPDGHVGRGEGVFERAGSPQRWTRPLLRLLQPSGAVYGGWETQVPFRIANRLVRARVTGERCFGFTRGAWIMRDSVGLNAHGRLVDEVGDPAVVVASFDLDVQGGALLLTSRAVGIRVGRVRIRLPRAVAPVVRLREAFDEASGGQSVRVTIDAPVIGRVYEYRGVFRYRIEEVG